MPECVSMNTELHERASCSTENGFRLERVGISRGRQEAREGSTGQLSSITVAALPCDEQLTAPKGLRRLV